MAKFKKPKNFRLSDFSREKGKTQTRWWFLLLFLLLVVSIWGFFEYGVDYFGRLIGTLNDSGSEEIANVVRDTLPPPPPLIDPLPEATNSAILEIIGEAEASSELNLFLNGETVKQMVVGDSGTFRVDGVNLREGDNNIYAVATDMAGNRSQESPRQTITLDKEPPELSIEFPQNNQILSGDEREIAIKGKIEEDAVITINERKIVVDLDGSFEASYSLTDGENSITIIAKDKAGNQTKEELVVNYRP